MLRIVSSCLKFSWMFFAIFSIVYIVRSGSVLANELIYEDNGQRDPFTPLVTGEKKVVSGLSGVENIRDLTVEGIVIDPAGESIVILNGVLLKEGESGGSVVVKEIHPTRIELTIHDIKQTLEIEEENQS